MKNHYTRAGLPTIALLGMLSFQTQVGQASPATIDKAGVLVRPSVRALRSASVSSFLSTPVLSITVGDYMQNKAIAPNTWMVQAATDSPSGCTLYVSGLPTGSMSLDHFFIRPHSLSGSGSVAPEWQTLLGAEIKAVPSTATPIWVSSEAHASVNVLSLDLEVRALASCPAGSSGVSLTFFVVPNP